MEKIIKESKLILISLLTAAAAAFIWGVVSSYNYSERIQEGIADEVVRFHVLANSNSESDQELKLLVRDSVLDAAAPYVKNCKSKEEAVNALKKAEPVMKEAAESVISKNGREYGVEIKFENCFFPVKNYGKAVFPAGYYDAVRVEIGSAEGKNWWCVMYPSLCFVEETMENGEEKKLKNILTDEEYSIVMGNGKISGFKFKIVEWWQEKKEK